LCLTLALTF